MCYNSRMRTRATFVTSLYSVALGLTGVGFLIAVTQPGLLFENAIPLAFFAALSFVLKRAGFHVAPQVTHSLVGIVDLAALFVFGPVPGAWVAATSGFFYLFLTAWRREQHTLRNLFEIPVFNAGLKVGMAYAASHVYTLFGGTYAPRVLSPELVPAFLAAVLVWFFGDHIGWGILEYLRGGRAGLTAFVRTIFFYSLLIELLPLPFSVAIAILYDSFDRGVFLLMALGVLGTAMIVQRFADTRAHLVRRRNELMVLNEFGQALSQAGFDADKIVEQLCAHTDRIVPADLCRIELVEPDHAADPVLRLVLATQDGDTRRPGTVVSPSPLVAYFKDHREPIRVLDFDKAIVYPLDATAPATRAIEGIHAGNGSAPGDGRRGAVPRSAMYCPLCAGEELIGILSMFALEPGKFHPIHAGNVAAMGAQAAVAIQNARLYASERKRATQLAIVSEVSRQVARVLDIDSLLQQVVNDIRERFGYFKVHLFTVDSDSGYAVFRASTDPQAVLWRERGWRLRLGLEGIVGWVAAMGEATVVDDVSKEPRFILDPDETTTATRSELVVPMIVGTETVGVLDVHSDVMNAFGEEDMFTMKTLAAQVAIAIEDTRLFNSQKEEAWYLNVLLQVAENLSSTTSREEALETVVRITPLLVGVARCAILLYDAANGVFTPAKAYGLTGEQEQALLQMRFLGEDHRALAKMRQELMPILVDDPLENDLIRPEIRQLFGVETMLLAPLMTRGELVGAMLVDQGTRARHFSQHEIQVVMGIANQAAVAIESARLTAEAEGKKRYDYELGLARQIQESFLPDACPILPDYEICSTWQPAREVGGDFYDFIPLTGGHWGIVIADVSDKGMAAALFMALARTIIRTFAIGKPTPHEALDRADDVILTDAHAEMFVTVFFSDLDPATGHLIYANAGHNPPLLYCASTGQVTALKGHGIALGVIPNISLEDYEIWLEPGDQLLLYTDGVTEAINAREEEFGAERLASIVAAGGGQTASCLVDDVTHAVAEFTGGGMPADDLTMIAIRRHTAAHDPGNGSQRPA